MAAYIVRRVLWFVPVLFAVGLVTFLIARATPGGPFDRDPNRRQIPITTQRVLNAKFGLDLPVWRQFTRYMFFDIETGDLLFGTDTEESNGLEEEECDSADDE